ncbi:hypothetical protein LTR10_019404 [Elasticomyces elasticus]|nr:hypothetical protein LTR10_019404 [Elasticomyces elasticus]KAK5021445.1 hypothetical protein LTS07_011055 [Exophiala sideris]
MMSCNSDGVLEVSLQAIQADWEAFLTKLLMQYNLGTTTKYIDLLRCHSATDNLEAPPGWLFSPTSLKTLTYALLTISLASSLAADTQLLVVSAASDLP